MKRWKARILGGLVLVGVGLLACFPPRPPESRAQATPLRLLSSTSESVKFEFALPEYHLEEVLVAGEPFTRVRVDGFVAGGEAGAPQLPNIGALIGLPPTGGASLRLVQVKVVGVPLRHPIYPEPVPVPGREAAGAHLGRPAFLPGDWTYEFSPDPLFYARDELYPERVVELGEPEWVRDHRLARVTIHPVRYNPVRGELELARRLVVEIAFEGGGTAAPAGSPDPPSPPFEDLLGSTVLNPDSLRDWRVPRGLATHLAPEPAWKAAGTDSYKVSVEQDGLHKLTYAALAAAGIPVGSVDPRTLQLFDGESEVSVQVSGEQDGSFDPGDALLFYGQKPRSRYADRSVYWLRFGDRKGLRTSIRSLVPASAPLNSPWTTARSVEAHFYDPLYAGTDGDHWYAADLRPGTPKTVSMPLMSPSPDAPTATLRLHLMGYTASGAANPDHHVAVQINGRAAGDLQWDGKGAVIKSLVVDARLLRTGANSVVLATPGDTGALVEGAWLDAVELDYALRAVAGDEVRVAIRPGLQSYALGGFSRSDVWIYDVTDPRHPIRLVDAAVTGGGGGYTVVFADVTLRSAAYYLVTGAQIHQPVAVVADRPSDLHSRSNGADYLVVAHGSLIDAVQPLVALRRAQGLRVAVVDVQDVYDEFSGGLLDPEAIHAFVAYAYQNWAAPAPSYVLLVGDGHYDYLDHYGYGAPNLVPPYLGMVDPWWGETAADNRYAAVVGEDILPDVMLGRLPVTNATEAAAVVAKIVSYERTPLPGEWNARHVFVADNTDAAGDFDRPLDAVYNEYVTAPWIGQRIYLDDLSAEAGRLETMAAWQRGALLISYMGHSSWHQWAEEPLFDIHDVSALQNQQRWPVVLSMTCFTGFFHHPEYGTLDESFLRLNGGGAIATWSPSGLGVQSGHEQLLRGFYQVVFKGPKKQLGPAILAAKLDFYAHVNGHRELLDTYHLFGDPAMALNLTLRPWARTIYLPVLFRNSMGG